MRSIKKIVALMLTFVCVSNMWLTPTYAYDVNASIGLADSESDTVILDGVTYRYDFYSDAGNKITRVVNLLTDEVDIVMYDPETETVYINGALAVKRIPEQYAVSSYGNTADGWQILGKDSYYVSWAVGTSAATVAAAIAAFLANLGPAGVIAAIGVAALGSLASSCSGGTLYRELHMYPNPIQYRYKWSFRAPTGTTYGPYYYTV